MAPPFTTRLLPEKTIISCKHSKLKVHLMLHCRVSVVYPRDRVAEWELWLTAAALDHESIVFAYP